MWFKKQTLHHSRATMHCLPQHLSVAAPTPLSHCQFFLYIFTYDSHGLFQFLIHFDAHMSVAKVHETLLWSLSYAWPGYLFILFLSAAPQLMAYPRLQDCPSFTFSAPQNHSQRSKLALPLPSLLRIPLHFKLCVSYP